MKQEALKLKRIALANARLISVSERREVEGASKSIGWRTHRPWLTAAATLLFLWTYALIIAAILSSFRMLTHQNFPAALYCIVMMGLTVEFGDVVPEPWARWFMIVLVPVTVLIFWTSSIVVKRALFPLPDSGFKIDGGVTDERKAAGNADDALSVQSFQKLAEVRGDCSEAEYMRFMLRGAGVCSPQLLDELARSYATLMANDGGRGSISASLFARATTDAASFSHVSPLQTNLRTAGPSLPDSGFELSIANTRF
jgi:hypothetical protein